MTREQLNTDLLINILASNNTTNILLLKKSGMDRAEMAAAKEAIDTLTDKANTLSSKSIVLDNQENAVK